MADGRDFSTGYSNYPRDKQYVTPTRYRRRARPTSRGDDVGEVFEGSESIDLSAVVHRKIDLDDSDESSVDHNYDVESLAESIDESLTWRGRMQLALHSHWFHFAIVILVALDAFIVLFELLLDVGAFDNVQCRGETRIDRAEFCHFDSRSRGRCGPTAEVILKGQNLSSTGSDEMLGVDGLCDCKFRDGKSVCVDDDERKGVNPAEILHYSSLIILSVFMVEVIVKWIAFRLKYFTHKFEVFDGMIVVISWILDITSLLEEEAFEAASLLIILRLWRVVRIVNGAVLSAKAQSDQQLHEARNQARKLIHAFHKCQDKLDTAEEEKDQMKVALEQYKRKRRAARTIAREKQALLHDYPADTAHLLQGNGPEDDNAIDELLDKLTAIGKGTEEDTTEGQDKLEDKEPPKEKDPPEDKDPPEEDPPEVKPSEVKEPLGAQGEEVTKC